MMNTSTTNKGVQSAEQSLSITARWVTTLILGCAGLGSALAVSLFAADAPDGSKAFCGFLIAALLFGVVAGAAVEKGRTLWWLLWFGIPLTWAWLLLMPHTGKRIAQLRWGRLPTGRLRKLLPEDSKCPDCKTELNLTLKERATGFFMCKQCHKEFQID